MRLLADVSKLHAPTPVTRKSFRTSHTSSACHTLEEQHKLHGTAKQSDAAILQLLLPFVRRLSSFEWALLQ